MGVGGVLGVDSHEMYAPRVVGLFLRHCPAHVPWFVVAVVIRKAIDGVLRRWAAAHVAQKCRERVQPLLTDTNPAATVSVKAPIVRIQAAVFHLLPRYIFNRRAIVRAYLLAVSPLREVRGVTTLPCLHGGSIS